MTCGAREMVSAPAFAAVAVDDADRAGLETTRGRYDMREQGLAR